MKSRSSKPWKFQSTHSCRVRLINCVIWRKNAEFQSTHSCRVRRNQTTMTDEEMGDFNPRTRVECDDAATSNNKSCKVFQSTHSCRVRLYVTSGSTRPRYFNPRTRVECDFTICTGYNGVYYFNPRTRVECDRVSEGSTNGHADFNPRTRVECDKNRRKQLCYRPYFNPRTRVECDDIDLTIQASLMLFQSTHSCRVRPTSNWRLPLPAVFQSTHSCRVRRRKRPLASVGEGISIHALV